MEFLDHLLLLCRRWRVLALGLAASVAIAGVLAFLLPTEHRATAQLFVGDAATREGPGSRDRGPSQYVFDRMPSYAQLIGSAGVTAALQARLGEESPSGALADAVSATVVPGTVLVEVTATAADAASAVDLANTAADGLAGAVEELETPASSVRSRVEVTVARPAQQVLTSTAPARSDLVAIVVLCGLAVALLAVLAQEQARRRGAAALPAP